MTLGARFIKWGLGLFIFGLFLSFGPIGHYIIGANHATGEAFLHNISLWFACPWTMAVAVIQLGGLGMVALGLTRLQTARLSARPASSEKSPALLLCIVGLIGIFVVGYAGYFVFDAIWPSFLLHANRGGEECVVTVAGALSCDLPRRRRRDVQCGKARPQRNFQLGRIGQQGA